MSAPFKFPLIAHVLLVVLVALCFGGLALWQALVAAPLTYVYDFDSLMRMQGVIDLLQGQHWYDHVQHRLNPPNGVFIHWTKPVDMLLLLFALPLSSFLPIQTAVLVSAAFVPPVFMVISVYLLLWAVRPLKVAAPVQLYLVLVCAAAPICWGGYGSFAVDHHFLLITLSIAATGLVVHLLSAAEIFLKKYSLTLGAVIGLGIWVSPEFMVFSGVCLAYSGCCWIGNPERYRFVLPDILKTITFLLCLAVLWERRPLWAVEHDTVSIVHLTLFVLLAGLSILLKRFHALHSGMARFQGAALGVVFVVGVMELLFTGFHRAHYNHVSAFVDENLLAYIIELQGLFAAQGKNLLVFYAYIYVFIIGMGGFLSKRVRAIWRANAAPYFFLFVIAIAMLYMAMLQQRWAAYSIAPMALFSVAVVSVLLKDTAESLSELAARCRLDIKFLATGMLAISLAGGGLASAFVGFSIAKPEEAKGIEQKACNAALHKFIREGKLNTVLQKPDGLVLAPTDWAPSILFWTPHSAVAGNYHRDTDGIKAVVGFFKAQTADEAKAIVMERKVDVVVYCDNEGLLLRYETLKSPFFKSIQEGTMQPWFTLVPVEKEPHLKVLRIIQK
jgi:hypothetical protein